jgi:hypothetical protein
MGENETERVFIVAHTKVDYYHHCYIHGLNPYSEAEYVGDGHILTTATGQVALTRVAYRHPYFEEILAHLKTGLREKRLQVPIEIQSRWLREPTGKPWREYASDDEYPRSRDRDCVRY